MKKADVDRGTEQVIKALKDLGYAAEEALKIMEEFAVMFAPPPPRISAFQVARSLRRVMRRLSADSKKLAKDDQGRST